MNQTGNYFMDHSSVPVTKRHPGFPANALLFIIISYGHQMGSLSGQPFPSHNNPPPAVPFFQDWPPQHIGRQLGVQVGGRGELLGWAEQPHHQAAPLHDQHGLVERGSWEGVDAGHQEKGQPFCHRRLCSCHWLCRCVLGMWVWNLERSCVDRAGRLSNWCDICKVVKVVPANQSDHHCKRSGTQHLYFH